MTEAKHTPEAESLADAILRAAGSGLRHYTMHKTREEILTAAKRGIDATRAELLAALLAASEWIDEQHGEPRTEIQAAVQQAIADATGSPFGHCMPAKARAA